MSRSVSIALCIFSAALLCVSPLFAQAERKTHSQLPAQPAEPFKLERGISFSASVPSTAQRNYSLSENAKSAGRGIVTQDFREAMELIRSHHVDGNKLDHNELTKISLTAMLRALDPHSNYYDAGEYRELLSDENSEYIGIGASIANFTRGGVTQTYVTSTFPGSPAFRAGLRFGDRIVSVGGEKMENKASYYVRQKIRGDRGTVARLTVERAGIGKIEALEIRRGVVPQPSIPDAYLLRPGVGYVDLSGGFTYTTGEELDVALKDLREQGMTSLILDLRDNPGGILEQAVKVAEKFLPPGQVVVKQRGRSEIDNRTWKSNYKHPENVPLVVLVNGGSASASEIVAGALQDYDRALVVGEKTFGKGLVQSVINLPYGSGLTLTTAKYYTPSGRSIQRDYSSGNLYDYYQHKASLGPETQKTPGGKTVTGRNVYGGDGIQPDETVKNSLLTPAQAGLLDALFFFSVEAVNGRVENLSGYKLARPVQFGHRIRPNDFPAGEELFTAFKRYLSKQPAAAAGGGGAKISAEQIEANRKFILLRLRFNLATAAFGGVAANQVLVENDLQVAKAVEALPRAQTLALSARRSLQNRGR